MTVPTLTPPSVQCPECGVHSIVEYKPTVYHCLKCGFEKDLSIPPESNESGLGSAIMGFVGFGLVLLILL
ncbi:hypothetical protein IQ273_13255 [Nodosilinea sp. LEGE 07298]|jgi:hypothetical protein|uniref:hypothetical protein n=1 Tax=Nodosilinea sp. LEGE 07298 TaxID=2777970 RepID=UPI001882E199|nr:hypothetical protein [Nodosilinea sp. LEGE 07298]MBE9110382.1 hypothetical protein [Nodosilinea sp. LEGE 07298]